ncbi:hypothetical protein QE152_g33061 [Popillia japonica]|uniref:Uncharacterized protein n=1 Tax=Popillia japonica TaxID=7064 RepID=A0AAW1IYC6_POPJA
MITEDKTRKIQARHEDIQTGQFGIRWRFVVNDGVEDDVGMFWIVFVCNFKQRPYEQHSEVIEHATTVTTTTDVIL